MPFIPSRGVIGTDLVNLHPNWKIIEDPYNEGHDILLVRQSARTSPSSTHSRPIGPATSWPPATMTA